MVLDKRMCTPRQTTNGYTRAKGAFGDKRTTRRQDGDAKEQELHSHRRQKARGGDPDAWQRVQLSLARARDLSSGFTTF